MNQLSKLRELIFTTLSPARADWFNVSVFEQPVNFETRLPLVRGLASVVLLHKTDEDELPIEFLAHISRTLHKYLTRKKYGQAQWFRRTIDRHSGLMRVRVNDSASLLIQNRADETFIYLTNLHMIRRDLSREDVREFILEVLRDADNKELVRNLSLCTAMRALISPGSRDGIFGTSAVNQGTCFLREGIYGPFMIVNGAFTIQGVPSYSVTLKKEGLANLLFTLMDLKVDSASFDSLFRIKINRERFGKSVRDSSKHLEQVFTLVSSSFGNSKTNTEIKFVGPDEIKLSGISLEELQTGSDFERLSLSPIGKYQTNRDIKNNSDLQKVVHANLSMLVDVMVKHFPQYSDVDNLPDHNYFLPAAEITEVETGTAVAEGVIAEMSSEEEAEALSFLNEIQEDIPVRNDLLAEQEQNDQERAIRRVERAVNTDIGTLQQEAVEAARQRLREMVETHTAQSISTNAIEEAMESLQTEVENQVAPTAQALSFEEGLTRVIGARQSAALPMANIVSDRRTLLEALMQRRISSIPYRLDASERLNIMRRFANLSNLQRRVVRIEAYLLGVFGITVVESYPGALQLGQLNDGAILAGRIASMLQNTLPGQANINAFFSRLGEAVIFDVTDAREALQETPPQPIPTAVPTAALAPEATNIISPQPI